MSAAKLITLIAVFFLTSVISVVTGSTSLITVPVMVAIGIDAHAAVATNMLALTFMSVGGSLPFLGKGVFNRSHLPISILLTIIGSVLGALLLVSVPMRSLRIIIAIAMIAVACFSLLNKSTGTTPNEAQPWAATISGYAVTFVLGVYGGFFSGGYVTLLTSTFIVLFGMSFLQAVATTKVVNIFSSSVATLVFLSRGLIDVKLGLILGIAMFFGALFGGRLTLQLSAVWLRRIFVLAVLGLAVKMLWLW